MQKITQRPNGTLKVESVNDQPSLTQQHLSDDCDINLIMAKYVKTGTITHLRESQSGVYADLTQLPGDYQEAMQIVSKAQASFHALPAPLRALFNNSPQELISFLSNPSNQEDAIKLGLMVRREQPQQPQTPTPSPTPPTPKP